MASTDGSIVIGVDLNVGKAEKQLGKLTADIEKTEKMLSELTAKRDEEEQSGAFQAGVLDQEKAKLEEMKKTLREIRANASDKALDAGTRQGFKNVIPDAQSRLSEQQERVRMLQSEWDRTEKAVQKYNKEIEISQTALDQQKETAGNLAVQIEKTNSPAARFGQNIREAGDNVETLERRIKRLASRVFVFSMITAGLRELRKWMLNVIKTDDRATESIAKLKGALLTLAQPLVNVIIPAFTKIVDTLTTIISTVANFISSLSGTTAEESAEAAENLYDEQEAISEVGKEAKKAKKELAAFDEINRLALEDSEKDEDKKDEIQPDFSAINKIPDFLKNILADMTLKIQSLKIAWDKKDFSNKDLWITALSGILGAVIGASFMGISGGVIGLLLGLAIGIGSLVFLDDTSVLDEKKTLFIVVLGALLGAALGSIFGGVSGGVIGLILGAAISFAFLKFLTSDKFSTDEKKSGFIVVLSALLGLILGATFGKITGNVLTGAVIGLLLGATIGLTFLAFEKAKNGKWDSKDTLIVVLSAILGATLGATFGGIPGGVIGLLFGASIAFISIEFAEGKYDKEKAIASLRVVVLAILGAIIGLKLSGGNLTAGVIGLVFGLTIGFSSVAFDDSLGADVQNKAKVALMVALFAIIGALIGSLFPGMAVFGGIVGGIIGLTLGLAITIGSAEITDKTGISKSKNFKKVSEAKFSNSMYPSATAGLKSSESASLMRAPTFNIPALAKGAVIPPNREFMAVLGDQRNGTNIEAPADLIEQKVIEAIEKVGGFSPRSQTVILQVDRRELGRVVYNLNNEMTQRVGVRLGGVNS